MGLLLLCVLLTVMLGCGVLCCGVMCSVSAWHGGLLNIIAALCHRLLFIYCVLRSTRLSIHGSRRSRRSSIVSSRRCRWHCVRMLSSGCGSWVVGLRWLLLIVHARMRLWLHSEVLLLLKIVHVARDWRSSTC